MSWVPLSDTKRLGIPKRHTRFFHTKCWTLWAVICATGSASNHLVKYSMATTRHFIYRIASGKGPKMFIPHVWKGRGYVWTATPLGVHDANQHASDIDCIVAHTSCNLPSWLANNTLPELPSGTKLIPRHDFCRCLHGDLP